MSDEQSGVILDRLKSLFPKSIDLALDRPRRLLAELGHPERKMPPVIHIAGTNGKGSTLAMVRAGLEADLKDVHAYISPHLTQFHERIRLTGQLIGEGALVDVLQECEGVNQSRPISLFEITTCAAMLAFSRAPADYLLLEVGLGGRLDATNVIESPLLTVISPVSLDHQEYLGNSIVEIAREKAGILKPNIPCVVSQQTPEALAVIRQVADELHAPLLVEGVDWDIKPCDGGMCHQFLGDEVMVPRPNLVGPHQVSNAGAALTVLRQLGVGAEALSAALTHADWPGRMQKLRTGPIIEAARNSEVWLDGGHNPAAGMAIAEAIREMPARSNRIICGMLKTKDVRGYLSAMRPSVDKLYAVTIPNEEASLPASHVIDVAKDVGFNAEFAETATDAARRSAADDPMGRIVICGSLYLAGTILREHT